MSIYADHTNGPANSSIIILNPAPLYPLSNESNAHDIAFDGSVVGLPIASMATSAGISSQRAFANTSPYRVIADVAISKTSGSP